jgi:hypothetical protein
MERQKDSARYAPSPAPKVEAPTILTQSAPTVVTQVMHESAPFRWSQLVSTNDYRTFVANLRASGCPEQTVDEIVNGDVDYVFSLERRRERIDGTFPGPWSDGSEGKLVAYLLGQALPESLAETPMPSSKHQSLEQPLETPLVMQDVDMKALGLSDDQMQAITSVRQDFLNQTDGSNQDTNSPAYRKRWRRAQQAADNSLMANLGDKDFNKFEVMAYQAYLLKQQ